MSKMLIVIDMQNDFVTGSLGTKEAQEILPKVVDKIKNFPGQIMYTRDTHGDDYLSTQEGENLPIEHCIYDTEGWQLVDEIKEIAESSNSLIFDKPTFGSMALAGCLNGIHKVAKIDELELIGLCTDVCVISNALLLKATMPDVKIMVDSSCCAGVTPESHQNALEAMKMCQIEIL